MNKPLLASPAVLASAIAVTSRIRSVRKGWIDEVAIRHGGDRRGSWRRPVELIVEARWPLIRSGLTRYVPARRRALDQGGDGCSTVPTGPCRLPAGWCPRW